LLSADRAPQLRHPPPHHIWFSGGVGWPMAGPNPELGLLTSVGALNLTYRIQCWNFSNLDLPNLKDAQANVVVAKCRIHNDASVDISSDGNLLAALVPVESSHSVNLCIYSLEKATFAQCLYVWTFGANAISVSLSPGDSRYVAVGITTPRTASFYASSIMSESATVAQVLRLNKVTSQGKASPPYFEHVRNIDVSRGDDLFSLNSIRWLPGSGEGLIYGTNRGHLVICRPDCSSENSDAPNKLKNLLASSATTLTRASTTTGTQTSLSSLLSANPRSTATLSIGTQTSHAETSSSSLSVLERIV